MVTPSRYEVDRQRRAIKQAISINSGWVCQAWAMNAFQRAVQSIPGVYLAWGRESSPSDGAIILASSPLPNDILGAWDACVQHGADMEGAICFDVKSGDQVTRYNAIYVVAFPDDLRHVHIVPGQVWYEIINGSNIHPRWILRQCAITLDDLPDALLSLVAASRSTRDHLSDAGSASTTRLWYRNPSNGLTFDGWCVPPPTSVAAFTHIPGRTQSVSERSIQRLSYLLKEHAQLQLYDNPVKPLIADLILVYQNPLTGAQQHFFLEHKSSEGEHKFFPTTLQEIESGRLYGMHVLIVQSTIGGEDVYRLGFAENGVSEDRIKESDLGAKLADRLRCHGQDIYATMQARWGMRREGSTHDTIVEDLNQITQSDLPLQSRHEVDTGGNRQWRYSSSEIELHVCSVLNDQSWHLGQHVVLPVGVANSHGTSLFVEHAWTDAEKVAYRTSRTLPRPALDSRAIPIAFGRRLYHLPTGERQYLKSFVRTYDCSKMNTIYLVSEPIDDVADLELTLHCKRPEPHDDCTACDEQHQHIPRVKGWTLTHAFSAGSDTHPDVVDTLGECLGLFHLNSGKLWLRCAALFSEERTYKAHSLQNLLQSTWKHGLRRAVEADAQELTTRWAPCNPCWAARQLCDRSRGACGRCLGKGLMCARKRCQFFSDQESCGDPDCSEVHETDGYELLTNEARDLAGGDKRKDDDQRVTLGKRIPVCSYCWDNGWHRLCTGGATCYLCRLHGREDCVRTRCPTPDCTRLTCPFAHDGFVGACKPHEPRQPPVRAVGPSLSEHDKAQIAKERGESFKTIDNKGYKRTRLSVQAKGK